MTCNDFYNAYWAHYISLEKEFTQTCAYVSLDEKNYDTFSAAYLKLLLELGSEVDVAMKFYCNLLNTSFNGDNIGQYRECINVCNPIFFSQEVLVRNSAITLKPWNNSDENGTQRSPEWWIAYNKCKHDRTGSGIIGTVEDNYLCFANLKYTLHSLAGLYQILIFSYKKLAESENKRIQVPIPGSRLFELTGELWTGSIFYKDMAFYIDDTGHLLQETSSIIY